MAAQAKHDGILQPGCVGLQALTDEGGESASGPRDGYTGKYRDDISKQILKDELVTEARQKELGYFHAKGVWKKCPRAEAYQTTGRAPISVRWVDVNKGDDLNPRYRSRLVARQMKAKDNSGTSYFAPTPPLEALRTILSIATTTIGDRKPCLDPNSERRTQISLLDISRAYFNAHKDESDPTFVELPREDPDAGVLCGRLLRHMYGTRGAADGWQEEYSTTLVEFGFVQGLASPCVFRHSGRSLDCTVHGDDFTTVGAKADLDWFENEMKTKYELTSGGGLGPGANDDKQGVILNRVVHWTEAGLEYEADPRQCEKLVSECGLTGAKSVSTPGVRQSAQEVIDDKPLQKGTETAFRGSSARANYLAQDRVDVQYASKEVCRWMSAPTEQSWIALKRLGRFLGGLPRLVYTYPWQHVDAIDVYVDTDWAGCPRTRKSTSGGCIMLGRHTLKTWSSTQASVSLSSGEAEFNGVVRGAGQGLGYQALLRDLGMDLPLRVWTDSSAAIGICSRQGLGKLRHLETHTLWIQQAVRCGRVDLRKIRGEVNPADLYTKHIATRERLSALVQLSGCCYRGGRASSAPQTRTTETTRATIGEMGCHSLTDSDWEQPIMPHISYQADELNRLYPSMTAPDDIEDDSQVERDCQDAVYQTGMNIARNIAQIAADSWRRRCLRDEEG